MNNCCPECGQLIELAATTCECGWYLKSEAAEIYQRKAFVPATTLAEALAKASKSKSGPWWTVDKVATRSQVQRIVRQAQHFGALSPAARFLDDCIEAGVITKDLQLR